MRRASALAALLLLLAAPATAGAASRRLFVNGDSLAVGTEPYLPRDLAGWRVTQSASISRHAYEGAGILRSYGSALPRVVYVSLGTNDDPRDLAGFRTAIRAVMAAAGPRRCVVWTNIVRPAVAGTSYAGYNHVLRLEDKARRNLRTVNWVRISRAHPEWFGPDHVHVTAAGYQVRAARIATAVKHCAASIS
jgi:lysophospholipase L1-like esterase